ncbi:unnamed protein product [Cyclocybe aegerita]|uniref:Uncharacterized protein n=1 Tax=Cyclocybe aegerita TaxID=1973307 RepID=A0A8S0XST6_CYCAE|nr:unnamed protein product [Cyclocybe aegerita]
MEENRQPTFLPRLAPHLFHSRRPAVNPRLRLGTSTPLSSNSSTNQVSAHQLRVTDLSPTPAGYSATPLILIFSQLRSEDAAYAADTFCDIMLADPPAAAGVLVALAKAAKGSEDGAGQLLVFLVQALQGRDLFAALIHQLLYP